MNNKPKGMMNYLKEKDAKETFYRTLDNLKRTIRYTLVGTALFGIFGFTINYGLPYTITAFQILDKKELSTTVPKGATINSLVKNELGIGEESNLFQKIWNKGRRDALKDALRKANESGYGISGIDNLLAGKGIIFIDYNGNCKADW